MANNVEDMEPVLPEVSTPWFQKQLAAKARRKALSEGLGKSDVMGFGQEAATLGGQALEAGQTREMIKRGFGGKGSVAGDLALLKGSLTPPASSADDNGTIIPPQPGSGDTDFTPGGADSGGVMDDFTEIANLYKSLYGEAEATAAGQLKTAQELAAEKLAQDIEAMNQVIDVNYANKQQALADQLQGQTQALGFSTAAAGSVRGSRREQRQIELENNAAIAQSALNQEIAMQKQLMAGQLKGLSDEQLEPLRENLARAQANTKAAQERFAMAEAGLLEEQQAAASAAELAAFEQYNAALEAQGLVQDPLTGEIVTTLEGEKRAQEILKLNAQTAEIYDKIAQPNIESKYFTDELGEVTMSVYDKDTGEIELVPLGKLDAAQKWALKTSGSGSGLIVAANDLGFNPKLISVYEAINSGESIQEIIENTDAISDKVDRELLMQQADNYSVQKTRADGRGEIMTVDQITGTVVFEPNPEYVQAPPTEETVEWAKGDLEGSTSPVSDWFKGLFE